MPNVSFDIFFDKDFINITATRGQTAPKAKPEWKVRTAPKLPPKPVVEDHTGTPRPPPRQKLTTLRQPVQHHTPQDPKPEVAESVNGSTNGEDKPKRKPPKLGPKKSATPATPSATPAATVASAGAFAGGAVNAVGNSINGVGESINSTVRRYGDGVKDYGNGIMDWTQAGGVRAATASNPLGLSAGTTGGKRQVTSPQIYRPPATTPKTAPSKRLMTTGKSTAPQKQIEGGTPKKALPAPGPKSSAAGAPTKKVGSAPLKPVQSAAKTSTAPNPGALRQNKQSNGANKSAGQNKLPTTPNPGAMRRKPAENGNTKQPTSNKKAPSKPNTSSAPKPTTTAANRPKVQGNPTAAANPLGLTF
ncbi:uncharacterized protein Z520_06946 [Fonsecaea multimorphosa CBS 102226]|uniref:Uncharacterized protein n=1 Tax=Fonsecaea multimorphosa CBS 102226 TaxID=1442371 RepID=A0A0D2K318_9EURO|nr:uncharacterized protein Z520_06946 [Fonsecaea multimorphosa CBS 102226]KIX97494.1 hypothetical protein Z520_06946 [Fonsecaea multimorphosa CBS 102226]OAL23456.1 hypothetical protein AYO22_06506 [Fonsecaea multimorphosa]